MQAATESERPNSSHQAEKLKVFMSYSRDDMASTDRLVAALEDEGFTVNIDRRDLPYGEKWQQVLYEFIRDCDTVLFLVSHKSIESQWVKWELQQVTDLKKRMIPVMLERPPYDRLPPAIGQFELLPKDGVFDLKQHLAPLVHALNTDRDWVMEATRLADRARDWRETEKSSALHLRGAALRRAEQWKDNQPVHNTPAEEVLDLIHASLRGASRRQRNWIFGTAASILLAIAGGTCCSRKTARL